tara:strand:+ start:331 stop:669 length:339 start_codon:yes stop_codon:yes gene_type:complete
MRKVEVSKLGTIILISEVIGIDRALLLCEVFQGQQIYIPKTHSIVAALRDRELIKEIKKGRERNHEYRNKRYDAGKLAKKFKLSKASIYYKVKKFCKLYKKMIAEGRDVEIL